jgi:hypothetical protein
MSSSATSQDIPLPANAPSIWKRLPLRAEALALACAFICCTALFERMAGFAKLGQAFRAGGLASFLLLFVQVRIADDLDDLKRDYPGQTENAIRRRRAAARKLLFLALFLLGALVLLNAHHPRALASAAVATALTWNAPFIFKRLFPKQLFLGFFVYEAVPASIFAYSYFSFPQMLPLDTVGVAAVVGLFWTGYEFWKFSRKAQLPAMQPYFLRPGQVRVVLSGLLILSGALSLLVGGAALLTPRHFAFGLALPAFLLVWLNVTWPSPEELPARRAPLWGGLFFISLIEAGLVFEWVCEFL